MHHALEIQEILSSIFQYFSPRGKSNDPERREANPVLAALARTCHTFKEPALNILWSDFDDLSPLARCLPEASYPLSSKGTTYAFSRALTELEWDILQSYASRIRCIMSFDCGLDWESVTTFLNPLTTKSLFPNLRILRCTYADKTMSLLRLPLPSLVTLSVWFDNPECFRGPVETFPMFSPNINKLFIRIRRLGHTLIQMKSDYICRWHNLSRVVCPGVALDLDDLRHLSRTPSLTQLEFALGATLPDFDSPLTFSRLCTLSVTSGTLVPITRLLSQIRLRVLARFDAIIDNRPSNTDLTSLLAAVPTSNASRTIEEMQVIQSRYNLSDFRRLRGLLLSFEDLRPCTVFNNLRHMELDITCDVGLTNSELLALAAAWPKLEQLLINADRGWGTMDGITPGGLVQLLQTCRSLNRVALRLDTRGYTEVLPSHVPANLGLTLSTKLSICVLDSAIEAESVTAITSFFHGIAACSGPLFSCRGWNSAPMILYPEAHRHIDLWGAVERGINDTLDSPSESGDSGISSLSV